MFLCFSKLTCMHFGSWDNNKEWSTPMNDDEEIMVIHYLEGLSMGIDRFLWKGSTSRGKTCVLP